MKLEWKTAADVDQIVRAFAVTKSRTDPEKGAVGGELDDLGVQIGARRMPSEADATYRARMRMVVMQVNAEAAVLAEMTKSLPGGSSDAGLLGQPAIDTINATGEATRAHGRSIMRAMMPIACEKCGALKTGGACGYCSLA